MSATMGSLLVRVTVILLLNRLKLQLKLIALSQRSLEIGKCCEARGSLASGLLLVHLIVTKMVQNDSHQNSKIGGYISAAARFSESPWLHTTSRFQNFFAAIQLASFAI